MVLLKSCYSLKRVLHAKTLIINSKHLSLSIYQVIELTCSRICFHQCTMHYCSLQSVVNNASMYLWYSFRCTCYRSISMQVRYQVTSTCTQHFLEVYLTFQVYKLKDVYMYLTFLGMVFKGLTTNTDKSYNSDELDFT